MTPGRATPVAEARDAAFLVVGSGIAGLTFALRVAERASVLVVTKKTRAESSTNYARGGIAAVTAADDSPALHVRDTLAAGAGLCHTDVVEGVVRDGPARIRDLLDWGVRFRMDRSGPSLAREGGHSRRRILHAGDRTGREIERALVEAVAEHPRIEVLEDVLAIDLLVEPDPHGDRLACRGAVALDHRRGRRMVLRAGATLLATGGCGQVFRHTTNPGIATGDGVAMAWRAGARIANMEFIQFHPTALHPTEDPAFLLSEALRGEGAVLRLPDGTPFMERHDPRGSLASRDVVARAIDDEMKRNGFTHVLLDVSAIPLATLEERFPGAVEGCRARGIPLPGAGIPVVPAAHYVCGGVVTDASGRTDLPGLLAAGEVACTGMHGANRLASNSLLEAVVLSDRAAAVALAWQEKREGGADAWPGEGASDEEAARDEASEAELRRIAGIRSRLRDLMWDEVGIVRTDAGLERADGAVAALLVEEDRRWEAGPWSVEGAELRNLLCAASLVVRSARLREESRGLHFNRDHPSRDDARWLHDTIVSRDGVRPGVESAGG